MNQDLYRIADEHLKAENERLLGILAAEESGLRFAARVIGDARAGRPLPEGAPESGDVGEWTDWLIQMGALEVFLAERDDAPESLFDVEAA